MASSPDKKISKGSKDSLGATLSAGGVNFALFSKHASEVYLLLFNAPEGAPVDTIKIENKTDDIWHVYVEGLKAGQLYGYKVNGEYDPAQGKRFNPNKLLIDPYAKAITGRCCVDRDNLLFAYDMNAEGKDMAMDTRDNTHIVPKSIVIDDSFDWQLDMPPSIIMDELVIYETHVKGFTAHKSSGVKDPGTYTGLAEKIPYLKSLGINAVELMPVQQFFVRKELLEKGLSDYWGYNTVCFFAPEISYGTQCAPGCQVNEFKTLVRKLHSAGIEVILDVVYNHTGEGNELGPTFCFKGIDNPSYYALTQNSGNPEEPYRYYVNDTGCGNTLNIESPVVLRLVLDSLRYWVQIMHVDGFRFDLAPVLGRVKGEFSENSPFFEAVSMDPVLSKVKMIAEPWDLKSYKVGNFPKGWWEWNDKFRDTARSFIKGDDAQAADMARRLTGSADLFQKEGKDENNSLNFITCHDGFTMYDLYSYNGKHNEANLEDNKDGINDNRSWNCGAEGRTNDEKILRLRKKMIKNALICLMFSSGTPMILYGDEVMRTQGGNNNAYCQDNEWTWFNWNDVMKNGEILDFFKKAVSFRMTNPVLMRRRFFTGTAQSEDGIPDISWFGRHLNTPNWDSPKLKTLCYQLAVSKIVPSEGNYYLFLVFNMHYRRVVVYFPRHEGLKWYRLVDTSRKTADDFRIEKMGKLLRNQSGHNCEERSVSVFICR
ncbi:MAG: glycogen debranching protein GlgX [Candidatus Omnitrophica bacterium]|nr:glycogen debranching protein GlgX [Candidatus Omnitrophota bacterium]MDD5553926.1 glycogen debranching protein GlgX [Candidatus Omnitrophota bacterium]